MCVCECVRIGEKCFVFVFFFFDSTLKQNVGAVRGSIEGAGGLVSTYLVQAKPPRQGSRAANIHTLKPHIKM